MAEGDYPDIVTIAMYTTLCRAIFMGTREVYYGDKRVVYRTLEEMLKIKNLAELSLGLTQQDDGRRFASYNNGFDS